MRLLPEFDLPNASDDALRELGDEVNELDDLIFDEVRKRRLRRSAPDQADIDAIGDQPVARPAALPWPWS